MDHFSYRDGRLHCEDLPAEDLAARFGTPLYVYSRRTIAERLEEIGKAFAPARPHICYSVKANANLGVLRAVRDLGAGFDAVSGGEIFRVLRAGGKGSDIVFAGVGKTGEEMAYALENGILMFNVESEGELVRLDEVAGRLGRRAPAALRVNPDVDPRTHRYITTGRRENKFGLDRDRAAALVRDAGRFPHVDFVGLHMHIGSQITAVDPYVRALEKLLDLADELRNGGADIRWVNIGGGFGIAYAGEDRALPIEAYAAALLPLLQSRPYRLALEPGRFVVGNAGLLLARVLYVKASGGKRFVITDAAMNDLIRPSLYEAAHRIAPALLRPDAHGGGTPADVVGPICESGDFLGRAVDLPDLEPGDLLAVFGAGAYGFAMASNYNTRPRAAEILVHGDASEVVRRRETWEDLVRLETPGS